ncbi:hypothetical protein VN97_g8044 [Penicillium thymicola]|uniref:Uncharacterized protein n=1 Tax=Penicillium thymicola TaxID=293382 RepID=A0AAI9TDY9_PENTH|nr:hypothetical protein VN97_g8044 [Penicillium thymicola]
MDAIGFLGYSTTTETKITPWSMPSSPNEFTKEGSRAVSGIACCAQIVAIYNSPFVVTILERSLSGINMVLEVSASAILIPRHPLTIIATICR